MDGDLEREPDAGKGIAAVETALCIRRKFSTAACPSPLARKIKFSDWLVASVQSCGERRASSE